MWNHPRGEDVQLLLFESLTQELFVVLCFSVRMLPRRILLVRVCTLFDLSFFFFCLVFGFLLKTLEKDWSSTLPASLLRSWVINCTFFLKKKAQSQRKTFTSFTHLEPFRLWFRTETLTNHTNWGSVGLNQEAFRMTDVCRGSEAARRGNLLVRFCLNSNLGWEVCLL